MLDDFVLCPYVACVGLEFMIFDMVTPLWDLRHLLGESEAIFAVILLFGCVVKKTRTKFGPKQREG